MMQAKPVKKSFSDTIRSAPLVLVDFHAEWCGPCKMMKPILEQLKAAMGDQLKILKVDVDKNPHAAQSFDIRGVPTLILFHRGEKVWQQSGVVPLSSLRNIIQTHLSD